MPKPVTLEFLLRVFAATAVDHCDDIWWRTDDDRGGKINGEEYGGEDYSPVTIFVNCSDVFYWASADSEEITAENIDILEQTYRECDELDEQGAEHATIYASELFAARVRKMRPQGACYKRYPEAMRPLFNAVGPEREIDFCNPKRAEGGAA